MSKLVKITEEEYNSFIKVQKDTLFFQSVEWANFKQSTGWGKEIVALKKGKNINAAAILLSKKLPFINKKMYYSPRGFIIDYTNLGLLKEFSLELKSYLKENKVIFLKINPYIKYVDRNSDGDIIEGKDNKDLVKNLKSLGYRHYGFYKTFDEKKDLEPRWLSVLELEGKSLDELIKNMNSTTRWMINKSQKNSISIREAKYDELKEFKKIMKHTSDRRSFQDRPLEYYQKMYEYMNKDSMIKLLFAEIDLKNLKEELKFEKDKLRSRIDVIINNPKKKNQVNEFNSQISSLENRINKIDSEINEYGNKPIISAGLYLMYGEQIVYLFGGSYKEFMGYGAQYLMQYEMIKYAKEKEYKKLNFYGIDGDFRKEAKHYGLFDFKRGFNCEVVELIGEFDLISDKFNYYLYLILFNIYKFLKKIKLLIRKIIK